MIKWLTSLISNPQVFAAALAAFGVLIAAIISIGISRKSLYLNSITVERTKWIGNVRSNIANISGQVHGISQRLIEDSVYDSTDDYHNSIREIHRLSSLITLQLNPFGEIDKNIIAILVNFSEAHREASTFSWIEYDVLLISHAQWLFKTEWEKVKTEAVGFWRRPWRWFKAREHLRRYRAFCRREGRLG